MVDPMAIVAALGVGADAIDALALLKSLVRTDELDRVFLHLDSVYGADTGLSHGQLSSWKEDRKFLAAFFAVSSTADWDTYRPGLLEAVLGLTAADPDQPNDEEKTLAEEVVDEIERYLPLAKKGDDVTRYVGNQNRLAIEGVGAIRSEIDWTPERGSDLFDELFEVSAAEAEEIQRALRDKDLTKEIPGLLKVPPPWLGSGSGLMWEVLAASAEGAGLWGEAVEAWEEAFERAGSDRVRARVRLITAAHISGDPERGIKAFAEAEEMDPTHPLVLFTKAEQEADPERVLAFLDQIEPTKDSHRALRDLRRAVPLTRLGRHDEAEKTFDAAVAADAPGSEVSEVKAQMTLAREEPAFKNGTKTDTQALIAAAERFLEVRDKHRRLGAHEGSVAYLSYAIDALLMAEERGRAISLMAADELTEEELAAPINRYLIAQQLLRAGRSDLAVELLPEPDSDEEGSDLLHAIATVQSVDSDAASLEEAIAALDEALQGDRRLGAAQARLIASLRHDIEWSEEAGTALAEADPGLAAVMRAEWLSRGNEWDEAEGVLLPHFGEPRAQHALLEIAISREDKDRIVARAGEILNQPSDPIVRLEAARALIDVGEIESAETELGAIAHSGDAPLDVRNEAFGRLVGLMTLAERHLDLLSTAEAWLELTPQEMNAVWAKIHALFRLGRFKEALDSFDESGAVADLLGRAQLMARIYGLVYEGEDGVRRIVELADSLDTPDEAIEELAMTAGLDRLEHLSSELAERVSAERFLRLFPDTKRIQRIDAPNSPEEFVALLKELSGNRNERLADAAKTIFDEAGAPVAVLATLAGQTVVKTWHHLARLPIGFGHREILDDERANAASALTLGAVWDPGALYLTEAIGDALAENLLRVLPKSVVCQATLDDVIASSRSVAPAGLGTVGLDMKGELFRTEPTAEEAAEEVALLGRTDALAAKLTVEPDSKHTDTGVAAKFIDEVDNQRTQFLTFLGSLAVAERLKLPVFSTDRWVRNTARRAGIRAFGLEAMIEALSDRGEISAEERLAYRRHLRAMGAMGTAVAADELAADARAVAFGLSRSVAYALLDPSPLWMNEPDWYRTLLAFLKSVHQEAPGKLEIWTARVLDALRLNHPLGRAQHGARLLALSFSPGVEEEREFTEALGRAVASACDHSDEREEPVLLAARLLFAALADVLNWTGSAVLVAQFANQMPAPQAFHARFVVFEVPGGPVDLWPKPLGF